MNPKPKDRFSRWILSALVLVLLAIIVLLNYSPQSPQNINLTLRDADVDRIQMQSTHNGEILMFGFDLHGSPGEDARQYLSFINYLENETGLEFGLRFTPHSTTIIDDLGTGKIQFAAFGVCAFLQAQAKYGVPLVARGLNDEGGSESRTVIAVPYDSSIQNIEDLRGKRFTFGSEFSTMGYLIPRIIMAQHGLSLNDLSEHGFSGSHQNSVNVIASGQYDAGGLPELLSKQYVEQELIRTIFTSEPYPTGGIAVHPDVPAEIVKKVKQALLDFRPKEAHSEGLYHWKRTHMSAGFGEPQVEDYENLRQWSLRFCLLDSLTGEIAP